MRVLILLSLTLVVVLSLGLTSCGNAGPQAAQPGTPLFIWNQAQDAFQKGNFAAASNYLDRLTGKDGEFRDRAEVLQTIVGIGLARGEMEWADIFEDGSKYARTRYLDFKRSSSMARSGANQAVMRVAEIQHKSMERLKNSDLVLAVTLPTLNTDLPVEAGRVKKGVALQESEQEGALAHMQQRSVMKAVTLFTGAGEDVAKARELMAKGDFKIPKETFYTTLAREYADLTELYGSKKLDQSGQIKMLCGEAEKALSLTPPSADTKAVQKKLDVIKKKLPKS
jgi:hypothetical protein